MQTEAVRPTSIASQHIDIVHHLQRAGHERSLVIQVLEQSRPSMLKRLAADFLDLETIEAELSASYPMCDSWESNRLVIEQKAIIQSRFRQLAHVAGLS